MKRVSGSDKYNPCLLWFIVKAVVLPVINSQQYWGLQSCPDFPLKMFLFEQKTMCSTNKHQEALVHRLIKTIMST